MEGRQLSASPVQIWRFAEALRVFVEFTEQTRIEAEAQLKQLKDTWKSSGAEQFQDEMLATTHRLQDFEERSQKLLQQLDAEANRLENIVRLQQRS